MIGSQGLTIHHTRVTINQGDYILSFLLLLEGIYPMVQLLLRLIGCQSGFGE